MDLERFRPLQDTNPEFSVLEFPGCYEYRVENWRLARDGTGKIIRGVSGWGNLWILFVLVVLLTKVQDKRGIVVLAVLGLMFLWSRCTQILSESVIVLPPHGIQLETRRGFASVCLSTTRRFIPLGAIQDVVINEGLRGWNVRYYMVLIKRVGPEGFALDVAFENLLPHHAVLSQVYNRVHDAL